MKEFGSPMTEQGYRADSYISALYLVLGDEGIRKRIDSFVWDGVLTYPVHVGESFASRIDFDAAVRMIAENDMHRRKRQEALDKLKDPLIELLGGMRGQCPCPKCVARREEQPIQETAAAEQPSA